MMLTREQAAAAWCPMVRPMRNMAATYDECADQRRNPEACRCIADQCAMWRWGEFERETQPVVIPDPAFGSGGKRVVHRVVQIPARGYCGLGGRPVAIAEAGV